MAPPCLTQMVLYVFTQDLEKKECVCLIGMDADLEGGGDSQHPEEGERRNPLSSHKL